MCTATWSVGADRVELSFARDERHSRAKAIPPRVWEEGGVRIAAPIDPVGGGTWLLVNEFGLCVCLLNLYGAEADNPHREGGMTVSRGLLPIRLAPFASAEEAIGEVAGASLQSFRPFLLCAIDRGGCRTLKWDGREARAEALGDGMATTSSHRTSEVEAYRKERYATLPVGSCGVETEARLRFHRELAHPDAAFNPMMWRGDAETQSLSLIRIADGKARFDYWERVSGQPRWKAPLMVEMALEV